MQAQVVNSEMLLCELPEFVDPILSVSVHNELGHDDLYKYLWSQKLVLETVASIWEIQTNKRADLPQDEQEIEGDEIADQLLQ